MTRSKSSSPPRPHRVVQIGVVGHRLHRLAPEVAARLPRQCAEIFSKISDCATQGCDRAMFAPGPTRLRVISPLAEGADRIAAEAALEFGAEIQCPLPFHAAEYSRDFGGQASREEFNDLLARATAAFELDGRRGEDDAAYERAGRMVIEQSDLLLAIWDGKAAGGRGGTGQMVEEAMAQNVPVLWLHAEHPAEPVILLADEFGRREPRPLSSLATLFAHGGSKASGRDENPFDLSRAYFAETQPRFNGGCVFTLFRDLVAKGKLHLGAVRVPSFESAARAQWAADLPGNHELPEATRAYLLDRLCPHYAWADGLSAYYGGLSRSGSVVLNLLSASAVFVALSGPVAESLGWQLNRFCAVVEFTLIAAILLIAYWGRRRRWHQRWLNYRQLAERLRQYTYLAPLGCSLPQLRQLPHFGVDPSGSWVDAMFRAVAREVGLPSAKVEAGYVAAAGELIANILEDQAGFHTSNYRTMHKLNHRLHRIGTLLFAVTLAACVVHVVKGGEAAWLVMLAAAPPAFGAAIYAIGNHGEFARTGDRSHAMANELSRLKKSDLPQALASHRDNFAELRAVAAKVAEAMMSETVDWKLVFRYRPLNLPG